MSRGLLLPRVGVEQHGIERTDFGNLGGGIYFSDSLKSVFSFVFIYMLSGHAVLM